MQWTKVLGPVVRRPDSTIQQIVVFSTFEILVKNLWNYWFASWIDPHNFKLKIQYQFLISGNIYQQWILKTLKNRYPVDRAIRLSYNRPLYNYLASAKNLDQTTSLFMIKVGWIIILENSVWSIYDYEHLSRCIGFLLQHWELCIRRRWVHYFRSCYLHHEP